MIQTATHWKEEKGQLSVGFGGCPDCLERGIGDLGFGLIGLHALLI